MMRRSLHRIAPTLLALGLLPASAWAAVSVAERDAHLDATLALIERDFRLPAQRQIADFQKAGYPEAEWHGKFLTWYHADRFRSLVLDKAEQARLAAEAKSLDAELKAAAKDGKLPKVLIEKLSGSGVVIRLVNDVLRVVSQDVVPDRSGMVAEKRIATEASVVALIAAATETFNAGVATVKARAKLEEDGMQLDDKNPKFLKMAQEGVELRLEAVRPAYFANKVLREIAERGKEFGLDDAPAKAYLQDFATKHFATLQDWDYNFGDYHPYLRALCIDLAAQAARYKVKGANAEDLAGELRRVLEIDVAAYKNPAVEEEIRTLQAKCWGNLLAWCREMGKDVAPKWYQTGLDTYKEFKEKAAKGDRHFRLDHSDRERGAEVARVYFQAGRLLMAKNDPSGVAAFGIVAAARTNQLAGNASLWSVYRPGGMPQQSGSSAWGAQPVAEDPAGALLTGIAMLRQANASGDATVQRSSLITAAVALRNGVLGLGSAAFSEGADEVAPELWFRYAESLSKLGMRWHAALASQAGLRHIEARTKELKGKTPWRDKNGKWTPAGRFVSLLAKNSVTYASNLLAAGKGAAVTQIYDDSISLVNAVSPEDGGKALDRIQIIIAVQEKDFKRALELTEGYVTKYPEEYYDAASIRTFVYTSWLGLLKDPERKTLADKALKETAEVAKKAAEELPKATDPARKKVLQAALRDGDALQVSILIGSGENEKALAKLGADYWKFAPSDPDKAAQMLGYMCQALRQWYQAQAKDTAKGSDAALLVASWPRVQLAYDIYKTQKARLTTQEEKVTRQGVQIAYVFNVIANFQIPMMRSKPGAPPQLGDIQKLAARAYADLIEPTISETSKPDLMLQVANVLWDLDEHARACRLLELYIKAIGDDPELAALRDTPKQVLAALDAPIRARPELRGKWEEVVDLLYDDPELAKKILEQDLQEADWREKKRDYVRAIEAIRALKADAAKARMSLGADFTKIDEGLAKLDTQVQQLGREQSVTAKLAYGFREQGEKAKANALYEKLINFDPTNPEFLAATVELTIDDYKVSGKGDEAVLKATQIKAARVRDQAQSGSPIYWTAVIQVMELSLALKDAKLVNDRLRFDTVNQSTPADDLQARPRQQRDDKRTRRARNALAIELCKRYLSLFSQPGITIKPSFAITEVEIDGTSTPVFVPVDAPKFTAVRRELDDGTVVFFLWEEGKTPPPEPEVAPVPSEPAAAPVEAPAPAPVVKPEAKP